MIDRWKCLRNASVAAAGLLAGVLWAHPSSAQVNFPDGRVACHDFARNGVGDWTVTRPTTISQPGMAINLAPGQTFMPSELVNGVEVTALLDRNCGNE